jgi:hypothetical protein
MKIITLIILFFGSLKADPEVLFDSDDDLLQRVTNLVRKLENATLSSSTPLSANIVNLWDVIPAEYRLLLLNQTQIQQLGYSYSQNLPNGLKWSSLPSEVKNVLTSLYNNLSFLNLRFIDWSWVNSISDAYADTTLHSLIPTDTINLLPSIQSLTNQLSLDQVVDTAGLRNWKDRPKKPINSFVTKIAKPVKRDISSRNKDKDNKKPSSSSSMFQNSPWSVVNQALKRAKNLLKSYNL